MPALPNAAGSIQRIVLTGFMGSGKTTVGRLLAGRLRWEFNDLDREVERRAGLTVPAIFAEHGEARFRELEAEALADLLACDQGVIALGGGAPEFEVTEQLLRSAPATAIVYLEAPFATLASRCHAESGLKGAVHRPLFEDLQQAQLRFARRQPLYKSLAHSTVWTEGLSRDQVVDAIFRSPTTASDEP